MNKKIIIGVGLVAAIGIFIYLKKKSPKTEESELESKPRAITKEVEKKLEKVEKLEPSAQQKLYEKAYSEAKTAIINSANYKKLNEAQKYIFDDVLSKLQYSQVKDKDVATENESGLKIPKKNSLVKIAIAESASKNISMKKWLINMMTVRFYQASNFPDLVSESSESSAPSNPNSVTTTTKQVKVDYFAADGFIWN